MSRIGSGDATTHVVYEGNKASLLSGIMIVLYYSY
jgi:hypothetical protein